MPDNPNAAMDKLHCYLFLLSAGEYLSENLVESLMTKLGALFHVKVNEITQSVFDNQTGDYNLLVFGMGEFTVAIDRAIKQIAEKNASFTSSVSVIRMCKNHCKFEPINKYIEEISNHWKSFVPQV